MRRSSDGVLAMPRGELLRIEDGAGIAVRVHSGSVWITQEGDPRDYWLEAGDVVRLDRGGLAVLAATRRAFVQLSAPEEKQRTAAPLVRLLASIGLMAGGHAA
jgi:hypothetical protein